MTPRQTRLISVLLTGALAACSGGLHSDSPATQVYVLRAAAAHPQATLLRSTVSLHVNRPMAGPGMDSDHILLVQSDHRMSYYVASRWPADLPAVVESLAVDTLRTTADWTTVQDSGSAFSSDYMLQIVIRRFEADYSGGGAAPEVHVVLDCTVGRRTGREVIASFIGEGSATAAANRLGDVVSAFEEAANHALADIATHTAQAVQSSQKVETPVPSITR
ncbi:MAG: cholesterol transport system auxiliary component [Gammaproteobacteria bacterium]|nr:cholesterol transport system auxiliary component [Gammaproteobacteria bacterium]